ncbi:hypothetical protein EC968_001557 [Mortierella alpina]|nr:hypothetical protein EC968_001557 [Mortierella alpina]
MDSPLPQRNQIQEQRRALAEDTVSYAIYLPPLAFESAIKPKSTLESVQLARTLISSIVADLTKGYIWHKDAFYLRIEGAHGTYPAIQPYLQGETRFGDSLDDEWMVVFLLREITKRIAGSVARVQDNDGEFLLIEAADFIPSWLDPDSSDNRVFIYGGQLHIIPVAMTTEEKKRFPPTVGTKSKPPTLQDALDLIRSSSGSQVNPTGAVDSGRVPLSTLATPKIQQAAFGPLLPDSSDHHFAIRKIQEQRHYATCQIPVNIARILKERPELVTRASEAFYTRDTLAMAACSRMTKFLPAKTHSAQSPSRSSLVSTTTAGATRIRELGKNKTPFVSTSVCFTKTCYAQLMGQQFQPPKIWDGIVPPTDSMDANDPEKVKEAELGMKLTCGFEILCSPDYPGDFGFKSADEIRIEDFPFTTDESWPTFKNNLTTRKYFGDERPGSQKYQELEVAAKNHFLENKSSKLWSNTDVPGGTIGSASLLHGHSYHPVQEIERIMMTMMNQDLEGNDLEALIDDRKSDDDSWMNVDLQILEDMMRARGLGGVDSASTERPSKAGLDMQQMLDRFGEFIQEGEGGIEGAEFLDEQSEDEDEDDDDDDDTEDEHTELTKRQVAAEGLQPQDIQKSAAEADQDKDRDDDGDDDEDDVFASDYEERQAKKQAAKRGLDATGGGVFLFGTEAMALDNGTASDITATPSNDPKTDVKGFAVDHGNFKAVLTRAFGTPSTTRKPAERNMDSDREDLESMDEDQELHEYMKILDAELSGTKVGQSFEKMMVTPKASSPSTELASKPIADKGKARATNPKTPATATKTQEQNLEQLMKEHMDRSRRGFSRQGPLPLSGSVFGYDAAAAAAAFADDEDDDMEEDEEEFGETTGATARVMEMDDDAEEEEQVDVDLNLAKNLLESFKSQGGLPGPGGNLLSRLGIVLPRDEEGTDDEEE